MKGSRFPDPYEGMSNDQLDRHFSDVLVSHRNRQRAISIRFPETLLADLQRLASDAGLGYQTLIKNLLEGDVERLQGRSRGSVKRPAVSRTVARRTALRGATNRKSATPTTSNAPTKQPKKRPPKVVA